MSKVSRNVIEYFSKGKEYVINNRTSTNGLQNEYSKFTDGRISFTHSVEDYEQYDAYYSNSTEYHNDFETKEECAKVENAIKMELI